MTSGPGDCSDRLIDESVQVNANDLMLSSGPVRDQCPRLQGVH